MLAMIDAQTIAHMTRNEADMAFKRRVQTIFEWLDPQDDDLILDMPCGRGFYLNMFRYVSNCRMVGAELDWDVLQKAKRNAGHLPRMMLNNTNIYALPYPDNTFDKIILSEVLEHIEDDVTGLREILRVLKPGGMVAITVPNANYPFWWDPINKTLETLFHTHIGKGTLAGIWANHVRLYTRDQLRNSVSESGLMVEEERAFTHHSFPFIHNLVYGIRQTPVRVGHVTRKYGSRR
jgi:SAM-dependent methyltransferase